jgi:hypothetical protein
MPAKAGIQDFFGLAALLMMDAGRRRHDDSSVSLTARKFNHSLVAH